MLSFTGSPVGRFAGCFPISLAGSSGHRFTGYFPYHARVSSQAIATAPPSASTASKAPAVMAHAGERLHAHHMNRDTSIVTTPAASTTTSPVTIGCAAVRLLRLRLIRD